MDPLLDSGFHMEENWYSFADCSVVTYEATPVSVDPAAHTLVFLHGRYGRAETWIPVVRLLASQYRCVWLDFPGFGRSFSAWERGWSIVDHAELVAHLIDRLGKVILVGHDFGGAVAQLSSIQRLSDVRGIVLLNCASALYPSEGFETGWFGFRLYAGLLRLIRRGSEFDSLVAASMIQAWSSHVSRTSLIRAVRSLKDSWPGPFERQALKMQIHRSALPVLLLWGGKDDLNPRDKGLRLLHDLPEAAFFEESSAGHWPHLEKPGWVVEKIREFAFRLGHSEEGAASNYGLGFTGALR